MWNNRLIDNYLHHFKKLVTQPVFKKHKLVVFVEEHLESVIKKLSPSDVEVRIFSISSLPLYSSIPHLIEICKLQGVGRSDHYLTKFTGDYIFAIWSKFDFIQQIVRERESSHYAWIDFGLFHNIDDEESYPTVLGDKIRIALVHPNTRDNVYNLMQYSFLCAGGYFTGSKEYMKKLCDLFILRREWYLSMHLAPSEERIISQILLENPSLFSPFFAIYSNILSNHKKDRDLIRLHIQAYQNGENPWLYEEAKKYIPS